MAKPQSHVYPRPPDPEESELIAAAARGDTAAQRQLFRREYPTVFATISRMIGDGRDVDDVVQDTMIAVFDALPTFRGEAKLSTWIDRIAVNKVFQYMRSNRHAPVLAIEPVGPDNPAPGRLEEQADAREGLRRLYAVLSEMTPRARMAFALYSIDGRSIREVASLMGGTLISAKVRIWRARREIDRRATADPVLAEFLETHRRRDPA